MFHICMKFNPNIYHIRILVQCTLYISIPHNCIIAQTTHICVHIHKHIGISIEFKAELIEQFPKVTENQN